MNPLARLPHARSLATLGMALSLGLSAPLATRAPASPLSDPEATPETIRLYQNLKLAAKHRLLYGQMRAFSRGKHTPSEKERQENPLELASDSLALVGKNPALVEFGLHLYEDYEFWQTIAPELHRRGILISLSSHSRNPDLAVPHNNSHKSNEGDPVTKVLDRESPDHRAYMKVLRRYGEFIRGLRDENGRPIPVLLRLYHEHTGNWFWWGTKTCTPQQYNELWRMTIDFLRDEMDLHHLILVISPSKPDSEEKFLRRFPGQDYIDVYGFDSYAYEDGPQILLTCARVVVNLARQHGKVAAITEFGYKNGLTEETAADHYSRMFLDNLKNDPVAHEVAYALTWFGNGSQRSSSNWSPYQDEPSTRHLHPDFLKFSQDTWTAFEGDLPNLYTFQREQP
ncbi:MAG: glycosyl hydrolase [Verrucomicrobiota bacterium]